MKLATYTLEIVNPKSPTSPPSETDKRVLANLPAMLEAVEEDLTDLLPEGYEVRVKDVPAS